MAGRIKIASRQRARTDIDTERKRDLLEDRRRGLPTPALSNHSCTASGQCVPLLELVERGGITQWNAKRMSVVQAGRKGSTCQFRFIRLLVAIFFTIVNDFSIGLCILISFRTKVLKQH